MARLSMIMLVGLTMGQLGFKQMRLERMVKNEIAWLDQNFGPHSLSTLEYRKHDMRIMAHWAGKLERNQERLIAKLVKCGEDVHSLTGVQQIEGGFSDYDEEKANEKTVNETDTTEDFNHNAGAGRARRSSNDEDEKVLAHLDFDYDYPVSNDPFVRNFKVQGARFNGKGAISSIKAILQGFAVWVNNHVADCKPHQPTKQMSRSAKWFQILAKKIVAKGRFLQEAKKQGHSVDRGNSQN